MTTPPADLYDISNNQGVRLDQLGVPRRRIVEWAKQVGARGITFKISEDAHSGDGRYDQGKRYVNEWREVAQEISFEFTGVYHWLAPDNPVELQRDNAASRIGTLHGNEMIQVDMEQAGLSIDQMQAALEAWEEVWPGRCWGYCRYDYANKLDFPGGRYWLPAYINRVFPSVDLMLARLNPKTHPGIWQWGGGAEGVYCDPVQARIDSNQIIDEALVRASCGYASSITPQYHPAGIALPATLEEPVWTVCYLEGSPHIFIGLAAHSTSGQVHVPYLVWLPNIEVVNDYLVTGAPSLTIERASLHDVQANFVPDDSLNGVLARIG